MKPMISVVPLWDDEKESYWMLPGYMKGIEQADGIPVMLSLTEEEDDLRQLADTCQGFLFTGGHDVDPALYGEVPMDVCGGLCGERDRMERKLLTIALEKNLAVLGICRGIQFINAALGGSLYQDIPLQHSSTLEHHQLPPYDRPSHYVRIVGDSPLYALLKKERLAVNSYHHQAICRLSNRLVLMAEAEDGLAEAVYMPEKHFVWAVQWHPEFSYRTDEDSRKILEAFVKAAGQSDAG